MGNTFLRRVGYDLDIHGQVGVSYQLLGDSARASEHIAKAAEGDALWALHWAGLFYDQANDRGRAEELWRRGLVMSEAILATYPENPVPQAFRGIFRSLLTGEAEFLIEAERTWAAKGHRGGWEIENVVLAKVKLGDIEGAIELLRDRVRQGRVFQF